QATQWVAYSWRPEASSRGAEGAAPTRDHSMTARIPTRTPAVPPPTHIRRLKVRAPPVRLLPNQPLPALQVPVANRAVHVDHALLEPLEEVVVERAIIDDVAEPHPQAI